MSYVKHSGAFVTPAKAVLSTPAIQTELSIDIYIYIIAEIIQVDKINHSVLCYIILSNYFT